MKRIMIVLVLIAVAISGCTEKSPSKDIKNPDELKLLSIESAENLSSFSLKSSMTQTMLLNALGANATPENATTIQESIETVAYVDLSGQKAKASGSTKSLAKLPGKADSTGITNANVYQIGNSTYVKDESGNWTHLLDPRSAGEIWGEGNNNQIRTVTLTISQSQLEDAGSDRIDGEDAYKLKIVAGKADYENLYNTAFGIAAKLTQYPLFLPSINYTELNKTNSMEKLVWISKTSYLPLKYQSTLSFQMTPEIISGLDQETGQMKMFDEPKKLGTILVTIETNDLYYGFDEVVDTAVPAEALKVEPISPQQIKAISQA